MISRSLKNVFNKQAQLQSQKLLMQTPTRSAGGGPKKPPMPSSERDFDIVLVGDGSMAPVNLLLGALVGGAKGN